MNQDQKNEKRMKDWRFMAIAATVQAIFSIMVFAEIWIIALCFAAALGAWYIWYILRFDWEYLLDHEEFSMAGFCNTVENNHAFARHIDPGTSVNGVTALIDTWKSPRAIKYFGRWTVFTDPKTGVRLFRDNMLFVNCWYEM